LAPTNIHYQYLEGQRQRLTNSTEKEYGDFWKDMSLRHPTQTAEQWRMFYEIDIVANHNHLMDSRKTVVTSALNSAAKESVGYEKTQPFMGSLTSGNMPSDTPPNVPVGANASSDELESNRKRSHDKSTALASSRHRATEDQPTPKRRKTSPLRAETVASRAKFVNPLEKYPQTAFGLQKDDDMDIDEDITYVKMPISPHTRKAMPTEDSIIIDLVDDVPNESDDELYGEPKNPPTQWPSTKVEPRSNIAIHKSEGLQNDKNDDTRTTSEISILRHETIVDPQVALQPVAAEANEASNSAETHPQPLLVRNSDLALRQSESQGAIDSEEATQGDDTANNFVDESAPNSNAQISAHVNTDECDDAELDAIQDDLDHVIEAAYEEDRRAATYRSMTKQNTESAAKHALSTTSRHSRSTQTEFSPVVLASVEPMTTTLKLQQSAIRTIQKSVLFLSVTFSSQLM